MVISRQIQITLFAVTSAFALLAVSSVAFAQPNVQCKPTETQPECHARLKCKANEELEACQKRLLRCKAGESVEDCEKRARSEAGQGGGDDQRDDRGDNRGDDRGDDRRDERGDDRRDDRGDDRGDDRRDDRGRERRGRDDDRGRDRRRRGRRGRDGGGGGGGGGGFEANKTFGLGLELGAPTGLNGKYFFAPAVALDFGLGWIYRHYYYGEGLHLYADILWHPVSLVSAEAFELPLYIGGGLRFWDFDYCDRNDPCYGGSALGIRIPFGIAFDFNNVPLDIFIQLVPVLDLLYGDYYDRRRDRNHFGIDLSAGIRFWFK